MVQTKVVKMRETLIVKFFLVNFSFLFVLGKNKHPLENSYKFWI
jgi:hypothetical protein